MIHNFGVWRRYSALFHVISRGAPRALWPDARRIVTLAFSYGPDEDPLAVLSRPDRAAISVYARHRDYHDVVKGKLKELAQHLLADARRAGHAGEVKVFVDTAPVMEKPLAEVAGLGWQGKHTNLVSRRLGSWFFLAEIFTDLPFFNGSQIKRRSFEEFA